MITPVAWFDPRLDPTPPDSNVEFDIDMEELAKSMTAAIVVTDDDPVVPVPKTIEPTSPPVLPIVTEEPLPVGYQFGARASYIGDVFDKLKNYSTRAKQAGWLQHNDSPSLVYFLRLTFCDDAKWCLPPGAPPFRPHVDKRGRNSATSDLIRETRRIYVFLEGGNNNLGQVQREKLFQTCLENLDTSEVKLLLAIKDRQVEANYGLTKAVVEQAFPGIFSVPFAPRFLKR